MRGETSVVSGTNETVLIAIRAGLALRARHRRRHSQAGTTPSRKEWSLVKQKQAPNQPALKRSQPPSERQQRIAQRAYELYVARGYQDGHDLEDWLKAERGLERAA